MKFTTELPKKDGFYLFLNHTDETPNVIYVKDGKYCYFKSHYGNPDFTLPIENMSGYRFHGPLNIEIEVAR